MTFEQEYKELTMDYSGLRCAGSTLPPFCNRTLHHPSFLPLYTAADSGHHGRYLATQTVHPINPSEVFYSDPITGAGRRILNAVSDLRVDCSKLNTPPPVMSTCVAVATGSDPFRSGRHPTRNLGSPTLTINALHPPAPPGYIILQLTQEEDQAITNLLKLHHQEPTQSEERSVTEHTNPNPVRLTRRSHSTDEELHQLHQSEAQIGGQLQQGSSWSNVELEAASTLSSRFSLTETDRTQNKSAAEPPEPPPSQRQGSETLPAPLASNSTQNDDDVQGRSGGSGWAGFESEAGRNGDNQSVCEETSRWHESEGNDRVLSDSEEDAVFVLLNLGDVGAPDATQNVLTL